MENTFSTPGRADQAKDDPSTIGGREDRTAYMAESKYEQGRPEEESSELDAIEKAIRAVGDALQHAHIEKRKINDPYSKEFIEIQTERAELKKKLIDLDIAHKAAFAKQMNEKREKQRAQQEEEREKAEIEFKQRQEKRAAERAAREEQYQQKRKEREQEHKKLYQEIQNLSESRRRSRLEEVQRQLEISESVRRREALQAEIDCLRYFSIYRYPYSSPYLDYYSYPRSYSLYPYPYSVYSRWWWL